MCAHAYVVYEHEYVSTCLPEHGCLQVPCTCVNMRVYVQVCRCACGWVYVHEEELEVCVRCDWRHLIAGHFFALTSPSSHLTYYLDISSVNS